MLVQQRAVIDHAAKMNLLAYASGNFLDHLGALLGVRRLGASKASCTVKFTLSAPLSYSITIPEGTRITPDGKIFFETTEPREVSAGETEALCVCTCTEAGVQGNGFMPGQANRLADVFPFGLSCSNTDESGGGTDTEGDEAFRERIHLAPESFTCAGSIEGYRYYALSADPNVIDAAVAGPPETEPGHVNIYILMKGGALPDEETLEKVRRSCSADDVRPDTDFVAVLAPEAVNVQAEARYWVSQKDAGSIEAVHERVRNAGASWAAWQRGKLGRGVNPSKLSHDILDAGASKCEVISPEIIPLKSSQIAAVQAVNLVFMGLD